jgi:sensor histidine kinase YesM
MERVLGNIASAAHSLQWRAHWEIEGPWQYCERGSQTAHRERAGRNGGALETERDLGYIASAAHSLQRRHTRKQRAWPSGPPSLCERRCDTKILRARLTAYSPPTSAFVQGAISCTCGIQVFRTFFWLFFVIVLLFLWVFILILFLYFFLIFILFFS